MIISTAQMRRLRPREVKLAEDHTAITGVAGVQSRQSDRRACTCMCWSLLVGWEKQGPPTRAARLSCGLERGPRPQRHRVVMGDDRNWTTEGGGGCKRVLCRRHIMHGVAIIVVCVCTCVDPCTCVHIFTCMVGTTKYFSSTLGNVFLSWEILSWAYHMSCENHALYFTSNLCFWNPWQ